MKAARQRCSLFDPTGNITALVEGAAEPIRQPEIAAALMRRCPEVEQVGFVRFFPDSPEIQAELRMAGGEFCGNASMSAAALYCLRCGRRGNGEETLRLRVSGAENPVELRLRRMEDDSFRAAVRMPPALAVSRRDFSFETRSGPLVLVQMQGIAHLIVGETSPFFALREDRAAAERAVKHWCAALSSACLGLMFLEGDGAVRDLTPLVYVPGSGTMFWESSCASGSAAVGLALAKAVGAAVELTLREPGGCLRVKSDPTTGETWLAGTTRLLRTVDPLLP